MKYLWKQCVMIMLILCLIYGIPCSVQAEELSGEIEVITNVNQSEMQKYKAAFEKKYPGTTVNYTTYHEYEARVKERIESGDYGDVLYVPSFFSGIEFKKYLEPLGTLDELSEKYYFVEKGWIYDDMVYGMPSYAYLMGMVYNTEVFDKAGITSIPKTMEEFVYAMELIEKHTDAIPFCTNCSVDWALNPWFYFPFIEMTGQSDYKINSFIFEKNPFSEGSNHYRAYKMLYDIVAAGYIEEQVTESNWYDTCVKLNNGQIGCIAIGSWAIDQIRAAGIHGDNIAFMTFPNQVDGKQYATAVVDFSYGIASNSDNKELARAYVTFMLEESGYALDHENISIYKADLYSKSIQELGDISVMVEQVEYGQNWGFLEDLSKDLSLTNAAEIQRIIHAAAGLRDESFDEIMQEWNQRWEQNRTSDMKKNVIEKVQENVIESSILGVRKLQMSEAEQRYITENPTIKVGYLKNFAPFSYEVDGEFQGASFEMCKEIQEASGLEMEYIGFANTQEMTDALTSGAIDMVACVEKTTANKGVKYSKAYISYANAIVLRDDNNVEKIMEYQPVAVTGEEKDYWSKVTELRYFDTLAECMEHIENTDRHYTITNFYSANYYIRESRSKNVSFMPSVDSGSIHFGFGTTSNDSLIAIINKCVYGIPESTVQLYIQSHMNIVDKDVSLKDFIEARPMLCLAIVTFVFAVILIQVTILFSERARNSQKRAVDMKRYEILSHLSDEYIFEYTYENDCVRFDTKFAETFSFSGDVFYGDYAGDNLELNQILKYIFIMKESQEPVVFQLKRANGKQEWYKMLGFPVEDSNGVKVNMIGKIINAQKEMEEKELIRTRAETDALTKLYNREGLKLRMQMVKAPLMIAILDIDDFKQVNDTLGHTGGDEALKLLARMLEQHMGEHATLARYGGDEFVILLSQVNEEEARVRLRSLVHSMDTELTFGQATKHLSISVGAVYCNEQDIGAEVLLKRADEELYQTKKAGKNGYRLHVWDESEE